mgnify:FL=1
MLYQGLLKKLSFDLNVITVTVKVSTIKLLTFTYESKDNVTIEYTGNIDTKNGCQKILDFINLNFPPEKFSEESVEAIEFNLLTQNIEQYMDELNEE